MKQIILFAIFLSVVFLNNQLIAQISTEFVNCETENFTEWTEHFSNDNFSIEYKFVDCDPEMGYDQESVFIKFVNKTSSHLSLNWHMILHYNSECRTCDYEDEYTFNIELSPNSEKTCDCSVYTDNSQLKLFSRFIDENYTEGEVLTGFSFDKIESSHR